MDSRSNYHPASLPSGQIAAVKLDLEAEGVHHVGHLLLVRTADGWKIAAAAWADAPGRAGT